MMDKKNSGQALLELAIFGSIVIMILGVLVSYGLRYNFEQQTMMRAFRRALDRTSNVAQGGQASYTLVQDKHIPHPANPFAVGSVMPSLSSAGVIRSTRLHETAEWAHPEELPQTTIEIVGNATAYRRDFKTAGFRQESIDCASCDKYKEIYGDVNVWGTESCDVVDEYGNPVNSTANINVIDSCEGEIISYDACKRQCRMITDVNSCIRECERGKEPGSSKDCNAICNQQIASPWYCAQMDNIFSFAIAYNKKKVMAVQADYDKTTVINNTLRKQEQGGIITTTDTINWSDTTYRNIIYNANLDASGIARGVINIQGDQAGEEGYRVPSTVSESATTNW